MEIVFSDCSNSSMEFYRTSLSNSSIDTTQINLHHCSSGETVRGERAKSVANCCLSVKTVRDEHVNSLVRPAVQNMESVHLHVFL